MFLESPAVAGGMSIQPPSLIETLRSTQNGEIPLLAYHLRRLHMSAQSLHYPCALLEIENRLLALAHRHQGRGEQRIRLLLHPDGRFDLNCQSRLEQGISPAVVLSSTHLQVPDPWLRYKTTRRPLYQKANLWLQVHPEYVDCLFMNQHGQLCEGSRSNVYLQLCGVWYTPPLICGVLPGVMRETLLESGHVYERILYLDDLLVAQSVRISNAVLGWLGVHFDRKRNLVRI